MGKEKEIVRCHWAYKSNDDIRYHDSEWGIPLYDDKKHFEFLIMEVMQCGLRWSLMMNRRKVFKQCFSNFNAEKVSGFNDNDVKRILDHEGMIKSEPKIRAIINNAKAFLGIKAEFGSFSKYIWSFSNNNILIYRKHREGQRETKNDISISLSLDMKKRGFKFLGPVVMYSHLQACGIINDHEYDCFRFKTIENLPNVRYID